MRTFVVGCNHRSAPVEKREKIAFDEAAVPAALERFKQRFPEAEVVLLSTCNRVEFYVSRPMQGRPRIDEVIAFIGEFHGIEMHEFADTLYIHEDVHAVRHLLRVASSLDSMVLGESQIIGQTRDAFETARTVGTVGRHLGPLFQHALAVAKTIHATTGIATGRLSVGSTAVDLARQIFSHFGDKTVMMVGAGGMGKMTLTHLIQTRPQRVWVTNRTDARAVEVAERLSRCHSLTIEPVPFADWIERLAQADIVITCTGSREPILTPEAFAQIPARRAYRPILLIDIALPRDIDAAVGRHDCVYLYNIDDLQSVTEAYLAQRKEALVKCHEIIEAAVVELANRQSREDVGPLIAALEKHFREIGRQELERVLPKLEKASAHDRELIEQMLHRVTGKLLHAPISRLTGDSAPGSGRMYAEMLRALFDLKTEE
ncbi:MAG: glutamyl-tRNA reductase [Phycisphaerae bacterium]